MGNSNGINEKQRLFVAGYLIDFNATQAAIRAGYSKKTAFTIGHELLKKAYIHDEISAQIDTLLNEAKTTLKKQIFDYWIKRAFYDITEILNLKGELLLTEKELREKGLHVCIDGIEKKVNAQGEVNIKYTFADKDKAVDMLQKYIQMIKEEQPVTPTNNIYLDLKALIINQANSSPAEMNRIINELEKVTNT